MHAAAAAAGGHCGGVRRGAADDDQHRHPQREVCGEPSCLFARAVGAAVSQRDSLDAWARPAYERSAWCPVQMRVHAHSCTSSMLPGLLLSALHDHRRVQPPTRCSNRSRTAAGACARPHPFTSLHITSHHATSRHPYAACPPAGAHMGRLQAQRARRAGGRVSGRGQGRGRCLTCHPTLSL